MNGLRTVWLVARWEFTSTLRRPSFVASLIGLPLTHFVLAALIGFSVQTVSKEDSAQQPIASSMRQHSSAARGGEGPDRSRRGCCASRPAHGSAGGACTCRRRLPSQRPGRRVFQRTLEHPAVRPTDRAPRTRRGSHQKGTVAGRFAPRQPPGRADRIVNTYASAMNRLAGSRPPRYHCWRALGVCFVLGLAIFLAPDSSSRRWNPKCRTGCWRSCSPSSPPRRSTGKVAGLSAAGLLQLGVYLSVAVVAGPCCGGDAGIPGAP